jgi:hypothetical protein
MDHHAVLDELVRRAGNPDIEELTANPPTSSHDQDEKTAASAYQ